MNTQQRIQRLEALLDRVKRRASEARPTRGAMGSTARSAPPAAAQPEVARSAPPAAARPELIPSSPPSSVREAIRSAPPAPAQEQTRSAPPPQVAFQDSAWVETTPPPPPVEVRADAVQSGPRSAVPEPFPFQSAPPGPIASEAMLEVVDTPPPEALGPEDVIDEIPSDMLESIPPSGGVTEADQEGLSAAEEDEALEREEEPPASSQRPKLSVTMDEVMARAAAEEIEMEEGREVPIKTPPPESGPQEAPIPAGLGSPGVPNIQIMLEAESLAGVEPPPASGEHPFESLEPPFGSLAAGAAAAQTGPTLEQLGETVDLAEGTGPTLELDERASSEIPTAPESEELEVELPVPESASGFSADSLPATRFGEAPLVQLEPGTEPDFEASPIPIAASVNPSVAAYVPSIPVEAPVIATMPAQSALGIGSTEASVTAVIARPPLDQVEIVSVRTAPSISRAKTFLEVLDGSIAIGR